MNSQCKANNITGVLLLNKPLGISSNAALQQVKRLYQAKKAGHTGSLDPLATGMLPICFGEATKFSQFLLSSYKTYSVTVQLGARTSTGDCEGEIVQRMSAAHVTANLLQEVMQELTGSISQVPPMFSALKHQGQPLYKLARLGIEIERTARTVMIHQFVLRDFSHAEAQFSCLVTCSKGTYIRTLIEDCAKKLNTVAHVKTLHREYVLPYTDAIMFTMSDLERMKIASGVHGLQAALLPMTTMMHAYPPVNLPAASAFYFRMGQAVRVTLQVTSMQRVQVINEEGDFLGMGMVKQDGQLYPERLLSN